MMDPTTKSAQTQDIGTVVAIVGTEGWKCQLCNTTFPRSFSIEHHMITSHHPHRHQDSGLPSANDPIRPMGHLYTGGGLNIEQDGAVGDMSIGGSTKKASVEKENGLESYHNVSAAVTEKEGKTPIESSVIESSVIKVEAYMDSVNATKNSVDQESLPLYFDKKCEHQRVNPLVDMESESSAEQGNPVSQSEVQLMHCSQNVQEGSKSTESCPQYSVDQGGRTDGTCPPQVRRRHAVQETTDSLKPLKWFTCSCGQEFDSKQAFKHHRRIAHCQLNRKTFCCPICSAQYLYKRGLNRHLADKGTVPILCPDCSKQFHDQMSLTEHRKLCSSSEAHYPVSSVNDEIRTDQIKDPPFCDIDLTSQHGAENSFPWECSKCKSHFWDRPSFRRHLKSCGILVVRDGRRNFCCNLCAATFNCLVNYHRHYVRDHKLVFLGDSCSSPVHFSPLSGNSPVPSPAPSVTSEINTAMAGVNLNQSRPLDHPSTIDLTSDTGMDEADDQSSVEDRKNILGLDPPSLPATTICSNSYTPASVSLDPVSLTSAAGSSDPSSLTSATGSSDPQSLISTSSSSNPTSLSTFSSSSLPCTAGSTGESREGDAIIISDMEESQSNDSSSESDDDWEIVMPQSREEKENVMEKGLGTCSADEEVHHENRGSPYRKLHHSQAVPTLPGHRLPPPPHPYPNHSLPPPPPFSIDHRFIPPHGRHFHPPPRPHHQRFCQRFFRGRGMCGPWPFFGAGRFGSPHWFCESLHTMSDYPQKPETVPAGASSHTASQTFGSACPAAEDQERDGSLCDNATQAAHDQWHSAKANPLLHAAGFCKWMGKWKEDKKCARGVWKKIIGAMLKSCQQGVQFLICPECLQTFHEESDLEKHSLENHPTPQELMCFLCQQPQTEPLSYNRHLKQHCETMLHIMNSRGGRGRGRGHGLMGLGRSMHHIMKWLWKAGRPYDMFSSHSHHTQENGKDAVNPEELAQEDFKECPFCKKRYRANSRESFFERHVNSHLGVEVYSFKCEECGKKFLEKGKFTAHQAKHKTSPYTCQVCGNHYQNKTSLKRHERIHTGERPHKCPDCDEGFIELRQLERHRMKHTGQDPFQCKVCEKGFTLKDSLLNHIRRQHPEENPNLCIKRAMPLSETDQHRKHGVKAGLSEETQASNVTIKTEQGSEPQTTAFMELD